MVTRKQLENREKTTLAPYAVRAGDSRGREFAESEDELRTCFQRDRDRVIHSKAFRRLAGKTQVFVATFGDHYRDRLSPTLEMAQLARGLARGLGL
ncbi:MAG: deoxyguanosinetriphosphate triphosphohydrolase, partial [Patescibacteria group bacterium]